MLPLILAATAAAATWLIWYYTRVPCPPEAAVLHHCNPASIARYVNVEIWAWCLTLGALIGGIVGGGVNYTMFSRERAARIAAEALAAEERKLREEERQHWEEERAAERQRVDQLVQQVAETQQQVVETQRAMLSVITELTAEVSELRRQRNGDNGQ